jgi:hypothetical protein
VPLDPALSDLLDTMAASASYVRPAGTDLAGARRSHEADAGGTTAGQDLPPAVTGRAIPHHRLVSRRRVDHGQPRTSANSAVTRSG